MLLAQIVQRLDGVSAFQGAKHAIKQQGRKRRSKGVSPRKPRVDNGRSDHQETTVRSDQGREITVCSQHVPCRTPLMITLRNLLAIQNRRRSSTTLPLALMK